MALLIFEQMILSLPLVLTDTMDKPCMAQRLLDLCQAQVRTRKYRLPRASRSNLRA